MSRLSRLVALACVLAVLAPATVAARQPERTGGAPDRLGFASLHEAVSAGALHRSLLDSLLARGSIEALVAFDSARAIEAARGRSALAHISDLRRGVAELKAAGMGAAGAGVSVRREYEHLGVTAVRVNSERSLLRLLNSGVVASVQPNVARTASLAASLPLIDQPEAAAGGYTGAGTSVAVLDTGLDYTRAAFGSCTAPNTPAGCRVAYVADTAGNDGSRDDNGHGTNVAGIVAAVAPGTRLIGLDVFTFDSTHAEHVAWDEDAIAAIDWVVANKATYGIAAVNLSLGDGAHEMSTCWESPYAAAFASARAVGVLPVVAAGNGGAAGDGVSSPACAPGALSVGAVYDGNNGSQSYSSCTDTTTAADKVTCFSQSGPTLGMLAPGALITAAEIAMSGTSQATPHVAGAAAVLAAARPTASVAEAQAALTGSGPTVLDSRFGRSSRRLDLDAAVATVLAPATSAVRWEYPLTIEGDYGWSSGRELSRSGTYMHTGYTYPPLGSQYTVVRYRRSTNGGTTWSNGIQLSASNQHADWVSTAASGTTAYAVWTRFIAPSSATAARYVYFRRNTNNGSGGGSSWSPLVALTTSGRVDRAAIATSGPYVYVVYTNSATGGVFMRRSANYGATWGSPVSLGTTARTDFYGRTAAPVVSAYGSYLAVGWLTNTAGAVVARISSNRGSTWTAATTLSTASTGGLDVAMLLTRASFAWTTSSTVRYRSWRSGTWGTLRSVYAVGPTRTHKRSYGVALALSGANTVAVVFPACRFADCTGDSASSGSDLVWRESASDGATWGMPRVLASSLETPLRYLNDAPDIEWLSSSRRYVAFNGWTYGGDSRMQGLVGTGPQPAP